jgi:hypothetical protein
VTKGDLEGNEVSASVPRLLFYFKTSSSLHLVRNILAIGGQNSATTATFSSNKISSLHGSYLNVHNSLKGCKSFSGDQNYGLLNKCATLAARRLSITVIGVNSDSRLSSASVLTGHDAFICQVVGHIQRSYIYNQTFLAGCPSVSI